MSNETFGKYRNIFWNGFFFKSHVYRSGFERHSFLDIADPLIDTWSHTTDYIELSVLSLEVSLIEAVTSQISKSCPRLVSSYLYPTVNWNQKYKEICTLFLSKMAWPEILPFVTAYISWYLVYIKVLQGGGVELNNLEIWRHFRYERGGEECCLNTWTVLFSSGCET